MASPSYHDLLMVSDPHHNFGNTATRSRKCIGGCTEDVGGKSMNCSILKNKVSFEITYQPDFPR